MTCEDRPDLVKVGLSSDPVRRAFEIRKEGAVLPIVEYGKQVSDAAEVECKAHEFLKHYHAHGEWFTCRVSIATNAILYAAGSGSSASKGRDEWMEE
jgi:hypothetical protein